MLDIATCLVMKQSLLLSFAWHIVSFSFSDRQSTESVSSAATLGDQWNGTDTAASGQWPFSFPFSLSACTRYGSILVVVMLAQLIMSSVTQVPAVDTQHTHRMSTLSHWPAAAPVPPITGTLYDSVLEHSFTLALFRTNTTQTMLLLLLLDGIVTVIKRTLPDDDERAARR